jgi:putative NADH-flavin reductase
MKIAVFGASGRTGRLLVEGALAQGHEVTAFARTPSKLGVTHENLRVVQGTIQEAQKVEEAVAGQDAVLVALSPEKPAFDTMTTAGRTVTAAMQKHGVKRLVGITGAGVPDPEHDRPKVFNHVISFLLKTLSGKVLEDSVRFVEQVKASGLDWTIVRVPVLRDGPRTGSVRTGWVGVNTGARITRADAADFMLRQLTETQHLRQLPMISN